MDRTQTACYALIAAAFVLGGLLIAELGKFTPRAEAELVNTNQNVTLLTTQTADDEEALFVLDGGNDQLLVYKVRLRGGGNRGMGRLELAERRSLRRLFGGGGGGNDRGGGRRGR